MKTILNALVILACIMACQSNHNSNQSMKQLLKTNQSEISYSTCGEGKTTLLFVHGWNINQSYWDSQRNQFCEKYQVVTMDLPGFGGSVNLNNEYSIESYGRDVNDLIEHLGVKNVVLIGHSMGGRVILEAVQENKNVIALVGVDNYKEVQQEMTQDLQAEADGFVEWLKADFANNSSAYVDQYLIHDEVDTLIRKRIVDDYANANPKSSIPAIEAYLSYPYSEVQRLKNLDVPLFLISSDMSPVDTVGLNNTGLNYMVFEMSQTGHFPMVEQTEVFNQNLTKALNNLIK